MHTTVLDTAVVGAGAAGLAVGHRLAERGERFELFDEHARIGDSWRKRYRSLRLFTPRPFVSLPGLRIQVGRFGYPTGAELADYLERYARHFALPIRLSTRVARLSRADADAGAGADGRFRLELSDGDEVLADRVIVTTGAHRIPVVPSIASQLDPAIRQLHSIDYRGPEQFADGPVLVVGAANSGTDVALDAVRAGHDVTLAGRHPGHVPVDIDRPVGNLMAGLFIGRLRRVTVDTPKGRAAREASRGHGLMVIRNSPNNLARAGVVRATRIDRVEGGRPVTDNGTVLDTATVVWCTGSLPDLAWIDIDGVVDDEGYPIEHQGLATGCRGLAFVGMPFQYSQVSPSLTGIAHDAEFVAEALAAASVTTSELAGSTAVTAAE